MPSDWRLLPLSELADWRSGGTPAKGVTAYWEGDIPWVSPKDMKSFRIAAARDHLTSAGVAAGSRLVPEGTVLLVVRGMILAHTFPVCLTTRSVAFNQDVKALVPVEGMDSAFLAYWFLGNSERMLGLVTEATHGTKRLDLADLHRQSALVPTIPEQRRIAEILDTVDEAIRKTEEVIAKLQQMKQGLLHDLLTRGIDDNGELRDPDRHPEQFKDSPRGRIPCGWDEVPLLEIVDLPSGQLDPRRQPYRDWILVAPDHISSGTGRLLARETAAAQNAISGKYGFKPGDIVYSKIRPYLRKAILADFRGLCSADMYPLRPSERLHPRFLLATILGEHFSRFAESVSMRSGFPKINREELSEYRMVLPPRPEQDRIAQVLDGFERRQEMEGAELEKLGLLKRGLMDDLLTGRVRVNVAAAEEDAA